MTLAPTMRPVVFVLVSAMPNAPATLSAPSLVLACPLPRPAPFAPLLFCEAPPGLALAVAVTVAVCDARMSRDAAEVPVALAESIAASVV